MKSGIIVLNKPHGMTSFNVVKTIKKIAPRKTKIGHTGTLDPFASGLLIMCVGRTATRLIPQMMEWRKRYQAVGEMGYQTDTLDLEGKIIQDNRSSKPSPSQEALETALSGLLPGYHQVPPIYSALKHNGIPLYDYARKKLLSEQELSEITESKAKDILLWDTDICLVDETHFKIETTVSKGTYIRVLIQDIADNAGTCATTVELVRTAVGPFTLEHAHDPSSITDESSLEEMMISVADAEEIIAQYAKSFAEHS